MTSWFLRAGDNVDEIASHTGRAIVEERYTTLRRQIPIVYLLAIINFFGLQIATSGKLYLGLNLPTLLLVCGVARTLQWFRPTRAVTHANMLKRLRQTAGLSVLLCLLLSANCIYLLRTQDSSGQMAVMLFGGLTAIGVAYGLSAVPAAARVPLVVLALPLAGMALFSNDPQFVGAAVSLAVVALLILHLLSVHNSHFVGLIISRSTITREQELTEQAREEAIAAATTDFLTGLPNRRAFMEAFEAEIELGKPDCCAVAIIDLDRFKAINDTFGHASGDKLLQIVARRLLKAAERGATVARLGGDEFGILLPHVREASAAHAAGSKIMREVSQAAVIGGRQFAVSACCGVGLLSEPKEDGLTRVLARADLALYQAKKQGSGALAVFEMGMEDLYRRRTQIERALQLPNLHQDIGIVFQPIVDLRSGIVIAHEALARWNDSELGEVPPSEFVPIAEQLNVIGNLTNHLMDRAFAEAAQWPASVRLSFNLSAVQLCSVGSAEGILAKLKDSGLAAERLQVEVTETTLLSDFDRARENLARLSGAGVVVVLDDFGAGYASIGYLKEMRFDQIKLDGSLVTAAHQSEDGERLLAAVIGLCSALGVSTVAEHIETEEQLRLLLKLGCHAGQGYLLQTPMEPDSARQFASASGVLAEARSAIGDDDSAADREQAAV